MLKTNLKTLTLIAATLLLSAFAATAQAQANLLSKIGSICMDAEYGKIADGTRLIVWPCKDSTNQTVTYYPKSKALKIGGKCLDAKGGLGKDLDQIVLWTCNGQPNQQWRFENVNDGYYIVGVNNKVIDVRGGNAFWNGILMQPRDLILFSKNGQINQTWLLGGVRRQIQTDRPIQSGIALTNVGGLKTGQIVAQGAGNIVAAGAGNIVAQGAGN